jgi:hypothetical protein
MVVFSALAESASAEESREAGEAREQFQDRRGGSSEHHQDVCCEHVFL